MSIASSSVAFFRTRWADALVDTCTINRRAAGTLNTTTGVIAVGADTEKYSGVCLVRPASSVARTPTYGEEQISVLRYHVFVPYTVTDVEPDDQIVLDTVTYDSALEGQTLRVVAIEGDSYNTKRRLICELNLGGGSST